MRPRHFTDGDEAALHYFLEYARPLIRNLLDCSTAHAASFESAARTVNYVLAPAIEEWRQQYAPSLPVVDAHDLAARIHGWIQQRAGRGRHSKEEREARVPRLTELFVRIWIPQHAAVLAVGTTDLWGRWLLVKLDAKCRAWREGPAADAPGFYPRPTRSVDKDAGPS
jgi:hypothetical protein